MNCPKCKQENIINIKNSKYLLEKSMHKGGAGFAV